MIYKRTIALSSRVRGYKEQFETTDGVIACQFANIKSVKHYIHFESQQIPNLLGYQGAIAMYTQGIVQYDRQPLYHANSIFSAVVSKIKVISYGPCCFLS